MSLDAFFAEVPAMIRGEQAADAVEHRLGPSPSGTDELAFYAALQARHVQERMRLMFDRVRAVVAHRDGVTAWHDLVVAFAADHPPAGWSLHAQGIPFADWLAARERPDAAELAALADWQRTRWEVANAPDDDVVGRRVAARRYDVDAPAWARALRDDPTAPSPPGPVFVVAFRDLRDHAVRTLTPQPLTLAVLARRSGVPLPDAVASQTEALEAEDARLVDLGVLPAR